MAAIEVGAADLQRMHLHHLRHGPGGVAADLETMAGLCGVGVADVVAAIEAARRSADPEVAGWAEVVVTYVWAAIETGDLLG